MVAHRLREGKEQKVGLRCKQSGGELQGVGALVTAGWQEVWCLGMTLLCTWRVARAWMLQDDHAVTQSLGTGTIRQWR